MERIGTIMLLIFVFCVKNIAECSSDTFVIAGWDVSLYWTLGNLEIEYLKAVIRNPTGNIIADLSDIQCTSFDNSFYCNISKLNDKWIVSLDIYNVSAGQSGNYGIQTYEGLKPTNMSYVNLVVIGKPKIKEVLKPILNQAFQITCDTHLGFDVFMYKWRINDTEVTPISNGNVYKISSLGMDVNFNHITCQVCLNETGNNILRVIWKHGDCSTDSDTYTIQVIYGPNNISLSLSESNFYLRDHEFFTIDCFANCKPNCTFRWKGQDTIDSSKLIFSNFEPRMAGHYTCYATNQETNTTSKSNTIILHHVKISEVRQEQYWNGPIIISVLLVIFGILMFVTVWRKKTSREIDSRRLFHAFVGQRESDVPGNELERTKILQHIPAISRKTSRLECHTIPQKETLGQNLQGDSYSTIDEDALSDYHYENSPETRGSNEHEFYDYAHSIEMCSLETADVHETDETYITPISDLVRSFEELQNKETDMLETDHAYLTVIDDSANHVEICQVEETDMKYESYLTPVNGSESESTKY